MNLPLSIPPVPCYTFFMKAARRAQAYILPHKKCIFPKKALDTKSARRIMPFDTRYPIPDTRAKVCCAERSILLRNEFADTANSRTYTVQFSNLKYYSLYCSSSLLCFEFRRRSRRNSRTYSFYNSHSNLHSRNCSHFRTNVRTYSAHSVQFFHYGQKTVSVPRLFIYSHTFGFMRRIQ